MAKTAVGLFESSGSADEVVRDLDANGFLRKDVRDFERATGDGGERTHEYATHGF